MNLKSSKWLYLIIALTSSGVFTSQVILSSILGIIFRYDFRFLSAAIALSGLGFGGIFASLFFNKIKLSFPKNILLIGIFYMSTTVLPFFFTRGTPPVGQSMIFILALIFLSSFVNFFFAGLLISLLLTKEKHLIFKLSFFDLFGAALAGIFILLTIDFLGLYSTIPFLVVLGIGVFFSCWQYYQSFIFNKKTLTIIGLIILFFLFILTLNFQVRCPKTLMGIGPIQEKSNSFSQISVYEIESNKNYFHFNIIINCAIASPGFITKNIESIKEKLDGFRITPFKLAYHKKTLIIGSGAGIDVSRALLTGSQDITAVEINPLIVNFTNNFPENMGNSPYQNKKVKTIISEARSYVSREKEKYDLILLAHAKNFGQPLGAQLFVPKNLYTLEAFSQYSEKLNNNGTLAIIDYVEFTRQYLKTLSVLVTKKNLNPDKYFIVLENPDKEATTELIIFRKGGILLEDREHAKTLARQYHLIYYPSPVKQLLSNNMKVTTDDKPFLWQSNSINSKVYPSYLIPNQDIFKDFLIITLFFTGLVTVSVLLFLLKMKVKIIDIGIPIFFVGISLGLAVIEFVLINKLTLLLENPVYSHIIILASILLFGGMGNLLAQNKIVQKNFKKFAWVMAISMLIYFFFIDYIISLVFPLHYYLRIFIAIAVTFFPSLLSGIFFPTALLKAGKINDRFLPWLWGIDTLAFIAASLIISFAALFWGIKTMLLLGVIGYIIAAITIKKG